MGKIPPAVLSPEEQQALYYSLTADHYDSLHVIEGDEHHTALRYLTGIFATLNIKSMLDVGSGTGRAAHFFERKPDLHVVGVEPSRALITRDDGASDVVQARGEFLPFADQSFDAVAEFGVLHHVRHSQPIVKEMMRVARRGVFLSDSNRFGQGTVVSRIIKLGLHKAGLWDVAYRLRTNGKGYNVTETDGVGFSYSVYDSLELLSGWADRILLIPISRDRTRGWYQPLLSASHVLLAAIRE